MVMCYACGQLPSNHVCTVTLSIRVYHMANFIKYASNASFVLVFAYGATVLGLQAVDNVARLCPW